MYREPYRKDRAAPSFLAVLLERFYLKLALVRMGACLGARIIGEGGDGGDLG